MDDIALMEEARETVARIKTELEKRIVGQHEVIDDLLACFLAGGHCLLVGVPGLAKTTLVHSLATCLDLSFSRIQFTPDLMPSDITGSEILFEDKSTGHREFRFVKGPVFANIVLADEINRTPPKTQSALLQAMQEREVSAAGTTTPLPRPFWVLATQNPIEQEGTYPLPEAQQDRFMFTINITYPDSRAEAEIVKKTTFPAETEIEAVVSKREIEDLQSLIMRVPVADTVIDFAVALARSTRPDSATCPQSVREHITWGAGPRASQYLVLAAKAYAMLDGRPSPDQSDVRRAAPQVLRHRLVRSFYAETEGVSSAKIVEMLLAAFS